MVPSRSARRAAALCLVFLAGCGGAHRQQAPPVHHAAARWPDGARYALDLGYDARAYALAGTERISFVNTGPAPLRSVWLREWANAFGSCTAPRAAVTVTAGGSAGAHRAGCTAQEVRLAAPLAPGARTAIALRVRVSVPSHPDRFGRLGKIAYFGNGIPLLAVDDRGGWNLPPYTDRGESFYSLVSRWDVTLRAPRGIAVASTGSEPAAPRAEGAALVHAITAPRARDFAVVLGPMHVATLRAGGVLLRRFTPRGGPAPEIGPALRTARAALAVYARRFGPYGAPELDMVQGPAAIANGGLAMEYPELVLSPAAPFALTHELAHQWWFGIVGDDEWQEPWLDEAMAEYTAGGLPNRIGGPDRRGRCGHLPSRRPALDSSMAVFAHRSPRVYAGSVYIAGACALVRLEHGLGRARMDRFLRGLVASHRYGVLTTADFVRALRGSAPAGFSVDRWLHSARIRSAA